MKKNKKKPYKLIVVSLDKYLEIIKKLGSKIIWGQIGNKKHAASVIVDGSKVYIPAYSAAWLIARLLEK